MNKKSGVYMVSYSIDKPGKEVVLVATKDFKASPQILNAFTGPEAMQVLDTLIPLGKALSKNRSCGWIPLDVYKPPVGVSVLIRRLDSNGKYHTPGIDVMLFDDFGTNYWGNGEGVYTYDAWQALPANTIEDLLTE